MIKKIKILLFSISVFIYGIDCLGMNTLGYFNAVVSRSKNSESEDDSTTQSKIEKLINELEDGYSQENFDSKALGQKKLALVQEFLGFYTAPITPSFNNALASANSFLKAQSTCGFFDDFFTPSDIPQQKKSKDDARKEEIEAENLAYQNEVATINNNNMPKIIIILALFDMYKDLITKSFMPNNNLPFCNPRFFIALKGLANDAFNVYKETAGKNSLLQKHFYDVCSDYNDIMKCQGWTEVYSGVFFNVLSFLYEYKMNHRGYLAVDFMKIIIFNEEHQIGLDRFSKKSSFGGGHIGTSFLIDDDIVGTKTHGICTSRTDATLADAFKKSYISVTQDSTVLDRNEPFYSKLSVDGNINFFSESSLKIMKHVYEDPQTNKKYFKISSLWPEDVCNNFFVKMKQYYGDVKKYYCEAGLHGFIIFDNADNHRMPVACAVNSFGVGISQEGQVISSFYPCAILDCSDTIIRDNFIDTIRDNSIGTMLRMYVFFDDLVRYVIDRSSTNLSNMVYFYRRALVTLLNFLNKNRIENALDSMKQFRQCAYFLKSFLKYEADSSECERFTPDLFEQFTLRSVDGRLNQQFLHELSNIFSEKIQGFESLQQDAIDKKEDFIFFLVTKCLQGGLFDSNNNLTEIKNKGSKKIAILGIINILQNYHIFLKDFNTLQTDNKWIDYCERFWTTILAGNSISIQVVNQDENDRVECALYDCDARLFYGDWLSSNNVNANNVDGDNFKYKYKQFKIQSLIQACKERRTAARNNRMPQPSI